MKVSYRLTTSLPDQAYTFLRFLLVFSTKVTDTRTIVRVSYIINFRDLQLSSRCFRMSLNACKIMMAFLIFSGQNFRSGSGGGRGEAIRNIYHSDRQLPPGHDPGADSGEAPNGRQRGSLPLDILVECRYHLRQQQDEPPRRDGHHDHVRFAPDEPGAPL
jgi:hypothetical protein